MLIIKIPLNFPSSLVGWVFRCHWPWGLTVSSCEVTGLACHVGVLLTPSLGLISPSDQTHQVGATQLVKGWTR